jgi:hypothetical protein
MRSSLFWDVTQRILIVADVWGQPIGPLFKGGSPSNLYLSTLREIPKERRSRTWAFCIKFWFEHFIWHAGRDIWAGWGSTPDVGYRNWDVLWSHPDRNSGYVQHFVTALIIPVFKGIWCFIRWILMAELWYCWRICMCNIIIVVIHEGSSRFWRIVCCRLRPPLPPQKLLLPIALHVVSCNHLFIYRRPNILQPNNVFCITCL